jgi:hypothetical protein
MDLSTVAIEAVNRAHLVGNPRFAAHVRVDATGKIDWGREGSTSL